MEDQIKNDCLDWFKNHSYKANVHLFRKLSKNKEYSETLKNLKGYSIQEKIYLLVNDLNEIQKCLECQKELKFQLFSNPYHTFCSKSCKTKFDHKQGKFKANKKEAIKKFKETFGRGVQKHNEMEKKKKETSLKNFGTEHPMKSKKGQNLYKDSMLKNHGVLNPMKLIEVKDKVTKTMFLKYNASRPLKNKEIQEKMFNVYRKTLQNKYNVNCVFHIPEVLEKAQKNSFKLSYFKHLTYQAKYELDFIKYCEKLGILDDVENGPFIWYEFENKDCRYFSDFYLHKYNLIIEIKSKYWYETELKKNLKKEQACKDEGFDFIFIIDKDYSKFNEKIKT